MLPVSQGRAWWPFLPQADKATKWATWLGSLHLPLGPVTNMLGTGVAITLGLVVLRTGDLLLPAWQEGNTVATLSILCGSAFTQRLFPVLEGT